MQSIKHWLNPSPGEPVLSPASMAFVSSTKTQVLQVAQMWQDTSVQCPGSWLLASLVGMQDCIQKTSKPCSLEYLLQKAPRVEREGKGGAGEGREPLPCHWPGTISHCWDSSFCQGVWEEGGEDCVGKTHKGRAVHSQTGLIPVELMLLPPPAPLETPENSDWLHKHTWTTKNYLCRHSRREFFQWHELCCQSQSCQGTAM